MALTPVGLVRTVDKTFLPCGRRQVCALIFLPVFRVLSLSGFLIPHSIAAFFLLPTSSALSLSPRPVFFFRSSLFGFRQGRFSPLWPLSMRGSSQEKLTSIQAFILIRRLRDPARNRRKMDHQTAIGHTDCILIRYHRRFFSRRR